MALHLLPDRFSYHSNKHSVLLLLLLVISANSEVHLTLHLTSGETVQCSSFNRVKHKSEFNYLCRNDTVSAAAIKGMTDSTGYHPYVQEGFLDNTIRGKISFYSGVVTTREIVAESGMASSPKIKTVERNKTFYTFDDSMFHEFRVVGSNRTLVDALREVPDAYSAYRLFRWCDITFAVGLGASLVPLVIGFHSITNNYPRRGIGFLAISAAGITVSSVLKLAVGRRAFDRSVNPPRAEHGAS